MLFEELMKNEYRAGREEGKAEGKAEGIIEGRAEGIIQGKREGLLEAVIKLLESRFTISDNLSERIRQVKDEEQINELLTSAVSAESVESFKEKLGKILENQVESIK